MENNAELPWIFPESAERYASCTPPKKAYFYFPKDDQLVEYECKNPNKTRRRIYDSKISYLPYERQSWIIF